MVLHHVQMQRYYMLHLLPYPLSIHYISLDHPKAHELTNHILQPPQEPGLRYVCTEKIYRIAIKI